MSTLFTKIIDGEIPSHFVFKDELWVGILDLFPVTPGHLLLIPRFEAGHIRDLPNETLVLMGLYIKRGTECLTKALGCDAVAVVLRDGPAAGQEIPHVHVHLVPRYLGDDQHNFRSGSYGADDATVQAAMNDMREKLTAAWEG